MLIALFLVIGAVLWAVLGMLIVMASVRQSSALGTAGTVLLVVLWLGGLAGFIGGAVRLMRPTLQTLSRGLERTPTEPPSKKQN